MNIGTAVSIFEQLKSDKFTEDEKIIAIHMVANMPTHNSISKAKILNALKWLVENDWEFEGKTERWKMTNYEKWLSKHTINAYMTECAALRAQGKCQICPAKYSCAESNICVSVYLCQNSSAFEKWANSEVKK